MPFVESQSYTNRETIDCLNDYRDDLLVFVEIEESLESDWTFDYLQIPFRRRIFPEKTLLLQPLEVKSYYMPHLILHGSSALLTERVKEGCWMYGRDDFVIEILGRED